MDAAETVMLKFPIFVDLYKCIKIYFKLLLKLLRKKKLYVDVSVQKKKCPLFYSTETSVSIV